MSVVWRAILLSQLVSKGTYLEIDCAPGSVQADFGDPVTAATSAALCIYDDLGSLVQGLVVDRALQLCGSKLCWKAKGAAGYGYKDRESASDGISKIGYVSGDAGKGKSDVKGKNDAAEGLNTLPTGVASLLSGNTAPTIQMVTSKGFCIGATMNRVTKDDGLRYKARLK